MDKIRNVLNKIMRFFAGSSLIAMVILTCWQVFTRYILSRPSTWSEELVAYLFAWSSLFAAAIVTGERGHMSIPILIEKMSPKIQRAFLVFAELIALVFSLGILVYGGIQIAQLAYGQTTSSLGLQVGFFYLALPICGVISTIYIVLNIIEILKGRLGIATDEEEIEELVEKAHEDFADFKLEDEVSEAAVKATLSHEANVQSQEKKEGER